MLLGLVRPYGRKRDYKPCSIVICLYPVGVLHATPERDAFFIPLEREMLAKLAVQYYEGSQI